MLWWGGFAVRWLWCIVSIYWTAESFIHQCLGEGGDGYFILGVLCTPYRRGILGARCARQFYLGIMYKLGLSPCHSWCVICLICIATAGNRLYHLSLVFPEPDPEMGNGKCLTCEFEFGISFSPLSQISWVGVFVFPSIRWVWVMRFLFFSLSWMSLSLNLKKYL